MKQNAMHIDLHDPPAKIVVTDEAVFALARRRAGGWMLRDYRVANEQRLLDDAREDLRAVVDLLHVDPKERTP